MSDLERFHLYLVERAVPHAVIGAAALGVHGVVRATLDFDLLTTDLVALKLFAGGWKDAQDVAGLLDATPDRQRLVDEVELFLPRLPREARELWAEILSRPS